MIAVAIAAGIYLGLGGIIGKDNASWLCIVLAAPFAAAGFVSYNGMNLEQLIWAAVKSQILFAGERKYIGENIYYPKERDDFD